MPHWNENLLPPNGFEFIDAENLRHTGGSLDDLISKVASYRARRGLLPGNPIAEVNAYLCKLYPRRCLNGAPTSPAVVVASGPSLGTRISDWLRGMWLKVTRNSVEFVSEDEVKRRVVICLLCPYHSRFPTECAACSETLNHISFQLRAGRDKYSKALRVCSKFSTDLRVDALTGQPAQPEAPENCWKRG